MWAPWGRANGRGNLEVTVVVQAPEVAETQEGCVWAQGREGWFPKTMTLFVYLGRELAAQELTRT